MDITNQEKGELFKVFNKFKSMVERQSGHKLKTNGGGEYVSNNLGRFYDQ